jgi:phosphatidylserine/phosphatidylglycerophosphate/cardiolipin synthase-like enzyme
MRIDKKQTQTFFRLPAYPLLLLAVLLPALSCGLGEPPESPWPKSIQVFFSEPGISTSTGVDRKMPERVGNFIRSAKRTVDINIYELSVAAIYEAILEVHRRGIKVRMVGDINNTHYVGYKALMAARVPMVLGNPEKIQHNKFVVVDREKITMGSMNYTPSGALLNNENVVFIHDKGVAEYYTKEMDNMFERGLFGLEKTPFEGFTDNIFNIDCNNPNTCTVEARCGGRTCAIVEVFFTPYVGAFFPNSSANDRLLEAIQNAKHTIHFAVFAFTSVPIAQALIDRAAEGVRVFGVMDKGWHEASVWSAHQLLLDNGINIRMDGNENFYPNNPYSGSKVHHKIMLFDGGFDSGVVFTGSFNFSPSAAIQGNDENCIFLHNRVISMRYRDEIEKMYRLGSHASRSMGGETANFLDVIINEVNWAGSRASPAGTTAGARNINDKFVELKNRTREPINIGGWQLWGTISTTYRMIGYIIPKGTIIPAGGYHVIGYSPLLSAYTWQTTPNVTWSAFDYLGTMHDSARQNFINLRLKDVDRNYIDVAGMRGAAPFAGQQGTIHASMQRVALDGSAPISWVTTTISGDNVKAGFKVPTEGTTRSGTHATPGQSWPGEPEMKPIPEP